MSILSVNLDSIPREWKMRPQWVAWRWKWNARKKTWGKVPIDPKMGRGANVKAPTTWGTFKEAYAHASEHNLDGVGFVFTPDDPYCGVDLDDCLTEMGAARLGVDEVIDSLESYTEISPSGRGLKSIVRATKPGDRFVTENTLWGR